jgi:hypothetical protein
MKLYFAKREKDLMGEGFPDGRRVSSSNARVAAIKLGSTAEW